MKIIALHQGAHGDTPAAIVEMTGQELDQVVQNTDFSKCYQLRVGMTVEISQRWKHLRGIEEKVRDAKTLPQKLRTLAEMLEMNVPAIAELTAPVKLEG